MFSTCFRCLQHGLSQGCDLAAGMWTLVQKPEIFINGVAGRCFTVEHSVLTRAYIENQAQSGSVCSRWFTGSVKCGAIQRTVASLTDKLIAFFSYTGEKRQISRYILHFGTRFVIALQAKSKSSIKRCRIPQESGTRLIQAKSQLTILMVCVSTQLWDMMLTPGPLIPPPPSPPTDHLKKSADDLIYGNAVDAYYRLQDSGGRLLIALTPQQQMLPFIFLNEGAANASKRELVV